MKLLLASLAVAGVMLVTAASAQTAKPTIVLVHGAFAESSSWNGVIKILQGKGYTVVAAANPLRSVKGDAQYVASLLASIKEPVVLVGHSYGGMVITEAAQGQSNVKALVYVDAFAPDAGESAFTLSGKYPGSTLPQSLAPPVPLADGSKDFYIQQDKLPAQFAADVPLAEAQLMAATQRPGTDKSLNETAGEPAWKTIPAWFIYGSKDLILPPEMLAFVAERAKSKKTVVVDGASHVVMISDPEPVAALIEEAAAAPAN